MEIETSSFREEAFSRFQFKKLYRKYPEGFYVAELSGKVIGYVVCSLSSCGGEIDSIAVDQRFRGRGVGRRLVELTLENLRQKDMRKCALKVRTTNEAALHFYQDMGFHILKKLGDYYAPQIEAYLMGMDLPSKESVES
jgi:ribosomal-protein-alanine N-acetyltransferase